MIDQSDFHFFLTFISVNVFVLSFKRHFICKTLIMTLSILGRVFYTQNVKVYVWHHIQGTTSPHVTIMLVYILWVLFHNATWALKNRTAILANASTSASWWRHQMGTFSALLALCAGNSPVRKGQWRGALMFSLSCARINGWVNNREAGDLRRHRAHYDVIVMDTHVLD